jgi:DNA topoisomerase-2
MSSTNAAESQLLSEKYQQKTDKQHILDNPDTYIGSIEEVDTDLWIADETDTEKTKPKIVSKNIKYIPGLFKLFDEGIVNCRDHVVRMKQAVDAGQANCLPVSNIDISISEDGMVTMTNDGNGIDVAKHPENDMWIPEMIFGHLRTSTNYNKDEKKIVGGKNGFGFKLVLIWSTYGSVETVDHVRGLKYYQEFKNNLDEICQPKISKATKTKPYTKIIFKPDYARLGIQGLTTDFIALLKKRVYDIAAVTDKSLKVKYNGSAVSIKNFQQYIDCYIGDEKRIYESGGERWEYAVAMSPTHEFIQVSFVNGIYTNKGGKHVEYILGQIIRKLVEYIEKKKKVRVLANSIKEQLVLFLRCDLENPAFDSQTKDYMNTPSVKFGSKCDVTDNFIEKLAKMGIMEQALKSTEIKENKAVKKMDGSKTKNIRGIPKLIDANWAGTEKSSDCIIIFCEGDSAKAGIVSGLSSEDRNTIGVYPMKGKILNVRGEPAKKVADNKEIAEIKKILGLEYGKEYKTQADVNKQLRYGKVLFMTDQDLDGHHIKGLGINLFQSEWPSLAKIDGFIGFMNTPILKANKGSKEMEFYNEGEYRAWKDSNTLQENKGWKVKYYKGLGTSTGKEFREYFAKKKTVGFQHLEQTSDQSIDMIFNKKRSDDRKEWLQNYNRDLYLDTNKPVVSYDDFINKEFIHFSKYDCDRSIPNLMDGLKISLRKILYSAFKKNLVSEIKVAQFSGYVSEHSGYHHGEASLNAAIVGLAQNFVGSNNINLFLPNGQFGTRLQGGKDSASERYIFTALNKLTRSIFSQQDDPILNYLDDDGLIVEPLYYAPIIPMVLVNGSNGIGTGFSTEILCYNPLDIIDYLKEKLPNIGGQGIVKNFVPYYEGFTGTITTINEKKFLIKGRYEKLGGDKIRVTELPVGVWTDSFKEHLENLIEPPTDSQGKKVAGVATVKDYDDMSKDTTVDFTIQFHKGKIEELEAQKTEQEGCNGLEKLLKLYTTKSTTNMHLFDAEDKLKKYDTVNQIIDDYFETRYNMYDVRKKYRVNELEKEVVLISNKARFIQENIDGVVDLRKKSKETVVALLKSRGYDMIGEDNDYQYLRKMPMDSVTEENMKSLFEERDKKQYELEMAKKKTSVETWNEELDKLRAEYMVYKSERDDLQKGVVEVKKKIIRKVIRKEG